MLGSLRQLNRFHSPVGSVGSCFSSLRSPVVSCFSSLRSSSTSANPELKRKWDIMAAVCIERPPYITPQLSDLEQRMMRMLEQKELEVSMLNDHELRHKRDLERQERKKKGEDLDDDEAVITALDMEDSWKKAAESFEPAVTASEVTDPKSVKREMDRPLRLIAKYNLGKDIFWDLPQTLHNEGETLRDTAERAIKQRVGDDLNVQVLGNAPWSFYQFKYPRHYQEKIDRRGAKVWMFKGIVMNDFFDDVNIELEDGLLDYQWATREELKEMLDHDTYKALDNMLHEED
jgi:large subunit ribosomal protein L46